MKETTVEILATKHLYAVIKALKEGDSFEKLLGLGVNESVLRSAKEYLDYEKGCDTENFTLLDVYTAILRRVVPYELLWVLGLDTHNNSYSGYRFKPTREEIEYFLGLNKDYELLAKHTDRANLIDNALVAFNNIVIDGRTISDYFVSFRFAIQYQDEYIEDSSEEDSVMKNMRLLYSYVYKGSDLTDM